MRGWRGKQKLYFLEILTRLIQTAWLLYSTMWSHAHFAFCYQTVYSKTITDKFQAEVFRVTPSIPTSYFFRLKGWLLFFNQSINQCFILCLFTAWWYYLNRLSFFADTVYARYFTLCVTIAFVEFDYVHTSVFQTLWTWSRENSKTNRETKSTFWILKSSYRLKVVSVQVS